MAVYLTAAGGHRVNLSLDSWFGRMHYGTPPAGWNLLAADTRTYAELWRTQPNLRTVIDYRARNIAQIGLHAYQRAEGDGRVRLRPPDPLAVTITTPNVHTTQFEWLEGLMRDRDIFGHAACLKVTSDDGAMQLRRLRPWETDLVTDDTDEPTHYRVFRNGREVNISLDRVLWLPSYDPERTGGCSPVETLRKLLAEEFLAGEWRRQLWQRGARMSGVMYATSDRFKWESDAARQRFSEEFNDHWSGNGPKAGGVAVLPAGLDFKESAWSPEQTQFLEVRKLSREEVAAVFQVTPMNVGILDNATYSNMDAARQKTVRDELGPDMEAIKQRLMLQVVPFVATDDRSYVEFNVQEKLKGSFEEQAKVLQGSVGGPWLTRNEARARQNLPRVDGGDELITPLNVTVGGQASPLDSAPPPKHLTKADDPDDGEQPPTVAVMERFFARQERAVMPRLFAKSANPVEEVFDLERWNRELADDLTPAVNAAANTAAAAFAAEHDIDDAAVEVMAAYLAVMLAGAASAVNARTVQIIADAIVGNGGLTEADLAGMSTTQRAAAIRTAVQAEIRAAAWGGNRAALAGQGVHNDAAGFGRDDTARRNRFATKVWRTRSGNPRHSHAALDGEVVPTGSRFSNGARWPRDSGLPAEERAHCKCAVQYRKGLA